MIKLTRPPKPAYLTPEKESELIERFKNDGNSVWKDPSITQTLLDASFSKCAYCECQLQTVDSYMEVEHFKHKDEYADEVVEWDNLLPSCKRCNTKKGIHDVVLDPILNPFEETPREHFCLDLAYIRAKDELGQSTIEVLDLNSTDRLLVPRFMITIEIEKNICSMQEALELFVSSRTTRRRNRLVAVVKGTLKECQPDSEFSATAATFLHRNAQYRIICESLRREELWDAELEALHIASESICLIS